MDLDRPHQKRVFQQNFDDFVGDRCRWGGGGAGQGRINGTLQGKLYPNFRRFTCQITFIYEKSSFS